MLGSSPSMTILSAESRHLVLARAPEDAGRPHQQQDDHRPEQHEIRELRQQPAAVGIEQADDQAADHRTLETAQTADDDHDQSVDQNLPLRARMQREEGAADYTREPGQERGQTGDQNEQPIDVDAAGGGHLPVVDPRAHDRADLGAAVEQPEHEADPEPEADDHEAG